jgi:hypothetical protein
MSFPRGISFYFDEAGMDYNVSDNGRGCFFTYSLIMMTVLRGDNNMANKPLEQYPFGITREWLDDNRIAVIKTEGNMARAAIDTWAEVVMDTARNWSLDQPLFLMHDLSSRDQGLTPYSRQRADETYQAVRPGTKGYIAVVVREGVINRLVSLFYFRRRTEHGMNLDEKLFTQREEGLAWLREMLKQVEKTQTF